MKWLVTGGAGYVGSHVVESLLENGDKVVIVDSLVNGSKSRIPKQAKFYKNDIRDSSALEKVIAHEKIEGIMHLAALKSIPDSFQRIDLYTEVNEIASVELINIAIRQNVERFIFSSTAAVYDTNARSKIRENDKLLPLSPYGKSKLGVEIALESAISRAGLIGTCLRFFNVVGARSEQHVEANGENLIPVIIQNLQRGRMPKLFGNDYPTPDGSCIRDYIDVRDVARAHVLAGEVEELPLHMNIGTGGGHSVLEIIEIMSQILGVQITPEIEPRRLGDAPKVIADVKLAKSMLNFETKFSIYESILSSIPFSLRVK